MGTAAAATHCNRQHHTVTHCNGTSMGTAAAGTHSNTQQHTATHCKGTSIGVAAEVVDGLSASDDISCFSPHFVSR